MFPYYGSKWNIARYYPRPIYTHVIEPFAGSAGYACFYEPPTVTLTDSDPIIVGVWDFLILASASEILSLPDLPNVGDCVDDYFIPQEAKWLIGFWLNRGSAQPKKTRTAYSARTDKAQLNWGPRAKDRIVSQLPKIRHWRVYQTSYEHIHPVRATWFVDPPYGDKGRYYRHTFNGYDRLGPWCRSLPGQVIVCEGEGATWLPFEPLGSFKSSKGRASEAVFVQEG